MSDITFTWDPAKNTANQRKHGVAFEEAQTVFLDENAQFMEDPDHSLEEERFLLLGLSASLRMLVVCHCYRECDELIRIISARRAAPGETRDYRQGV
ncbi:MAG: BrnT family toxin [Candidatus Latescibacteria bacterium]|nr:BrnT family toxin [Candidatus Latescibacterota bacterium]